MNINLTQQEANALLSLEKYYFGDKRYIFPSYGGDIRIPLFSQDKREEFMLDIYRSAIALTKTKIQNRTRKTIILARIDIGGAPHRNPDNTEIPCPHIHIYREGYADKWAEPLEKYFSDSDNVTSILNNFMNYCHIVKKPNIEGDLFV